MAGSKFRLAFITALAFMLTWGILPGCAEPLSEDEPDLQDAVQDSLGPYPMNVSVWIGHISLTLESVRIMDADAPPGSFVYLRSESGEATRAPAGSRFVDVTVRVGGAASELGSGGRDLFDDPFVVAEGTTIPVGARARVFDDDVTQSFAEMMEFAVPERAESAILHLPLRAESPETLMFRLW